ncbi:MAG TPA: sensor histidine kinase [Vicinamibacterales bacterium]|nr:sensor histidine kinase [Vicinamibacterales bacterium]
MRPPTEQQLDLSGAGVDLPLRVRPRYGVPWSLVLLVATLLGFVSSMLAWQLTMAFERTGTYFRWLVVLNCAYWYTWAAFTPTIVWLSQRFRFERTGLLRALAVHLPAVLLFSLLHIGAMQAAQWWLVTSDGGEFSWWPQAQRAALLNLDWEMMTYWAIVGLSHALLYYRESRDRELRASQLETRLVESQLKTLQQQLHPHFLFNTLNSISCLMHRDVAAADRTLVRLSDLLRLTLERLGEQEVTLEEELDFLRKYLDIERTRFADRLVVRFDVCADTLPALVPTLLLQPLVENAIKHGVARKTGAGHIDVTARRENDKLWIEIRDDGVGLSEDALTALHKGIGISTTRARLQHQFGADYRFEFHRLPQGVAVIVAVPWRVKAPAQIREAGETSTIHGARRIREVRAAG